jgi:hypothetical protein
MPSHLHQLPPRQEVQAIYFARQLEDMRAFQVVDRLVQQFRQGLLPLGSGTGAKLLRDYAKSGERLSAQERSELYFRALGARTGSARVASAMATRWRCCR